LKTPDRILERVRADFFEEIGLRHTSNGLSITKDDELPGILNHRKAAPPHFGKKRLAPDITVDIAYFSSDYPTFARGEG
jgi:hypothetical protein